MKKVIHVFLLLLMLLGTIYFINKTYGVTVYTHGDVNGDNKIDKADAKLIAKYIIDKNAGSSFNTEEADVNEDGKIKMNDALLIVAGRTAVEILPTKITLDISAIGIDSDGSTTITSTITPSTATDKTVTWTSSNTDVATINSNGKVTAKKQGVTTITAKTTNGKTATASVIVFKNPRIDSYESATLKYYIERPSDYSSAIVYPGADSDYHIEQRYVLYRIWVKDAYNQAKTVHSRIINDGNKRSYPMTMLSKEVTKYNYQNKGMVVVNASGFGWDDNYPDKKGDITASYVLNAGNNGSKVLYNATTNSQSYELDPEYKDIVLYDAPTGTQRVYGITKNSLLKGYSFNKDVENNNNLKNQITEDGVKYTFNFSGAMLLKYDTNTKTYINNATGENDLDTKASRTGICQIDEHNFIVLSTTMTPGQNNNEYGDYFRYYHGLNLNTMAAIFLDYGCIWAANLDGGGSQSHVYKKNDANYYRYYDEPKKVQVYANTTNTYGEERQITDLLYFVEQ